jgi:asparagine synthase (glutamine-hydrolysing)
MCGICGIFEPSTGNIVQRSTLKAMADTIRHRGPDDEGFYSCGSVGLAHRRLSIIDLEGGHQPLANEDNTIWIVFNGEIYNFEELNRRFLSSGHSFRTRSDTETIVHLYETLGEACFAELRGMFSLALWDGRQKKLVLARDRVGKKPLFYSWDGQRLLFASEIKALFRAGGVSKELDLEALSDYFSYQYVPAPKTIYRSVRKLRPAHYLVVDATGVRETPYWDIRFDQTRQVSEAEWCEALLAEYREAVKLRLISEVPLGAFLSGGIDSSSVVALMSAIQPPVTTCSIGFSEDSYDEAHDARDFATSLSANHFEHIVRPRVLDLIPKLAWHYDEPFGDSSAVPTYYVSQLARQHVTVALSGDGGDESFAGYRRYKLMVREEQVRQRTPAAFRRGVIGPLGDLYPKLGWAPRVFRAKNTLQSLARPLIDGYYHGISVCPPALKASLLSGDVTKLLNGYDSVDVLRYHFQRANTQDPLSSIQYVDIKTYLVDDILTKVDRASMANSLEVRCPLLDHKFMELIAQMPSSLKLHRGEGKYIFKKALNAVLPREVLTRSKKGFAMPVAEWFRGELKAFAHDVLIDANDGVLSGPFLTTCWNQHQRGQRDWSALLWCVLMFRSWQEVSEKA